MVLFKEMIIKMKQQWGFVFIFQITIHKNKWFKRGLLGSIDRMKRIIIKWVLFWTDLIKREKYLLKRMNETICYVHLSLSSMSCWKWWFMTNWNSDYSNITWWWMWFEKHQFNQIHNNECDFISMCINQFFYWGCVKTIVNRMVTESNEKNKNKENVFLSGG